MIFPTLPPTPTGLVGHLVMKSILAERTGEAVEFIKEWHLQEDGTVRVASYRTDDHGRQITAASGRPLLRTTEYVFDLTQPTSLPSRQTEPADPDDEIVDPDLVDD